MATQSSAPPPSSPDDKPQAPAPVEPTQPVNEVHQDVGTQASKQNTPTSVFVNSEPMREEQVQNAVKFLSHPKVRGSPVMYRRSFLEKKGLTKEEIDEAFQRVPDPASSSQPASVSLDGQVKASTNIQTQAPAQTSHAVATAPIGAISSAGTLSRSQFHWYHAIAAIGILAASGAGTAVLIKNVFVPRLKSWIRKVVLEEEDDLVKKSVKPSLAEEATAAAKSAAAAASDVARASQEMLVSRNEERKRFEELMNLLDMQGREMKSMSSAIQKLEGYSGGSGRVPYVDQEDNRASASTSKQSYTNGKVDIDSRSVRSSSPPASVEPSVAPHPKSYMEIMAMVQRGEKPSNIREINDQPPDPNQQPSNPRLAPRTKPWETSQPVNGSAQVFPSQTTLEALNYKVQDNGLNYIDDENSGPWWQRKNVRITEFENEDDFKVGPYAARTSEQPIQRTWVPPQPPPIAMAKAAEAIRRPKPSTQIEPTKQGDLADDQSVNPPADATDELQRITKISESGGTMEMNGGVSGSSSIEIQEEPGYSN